MKRKLLFVLLFSTFLVGCDTSAIKNMLPKKEPVLEEGKEYQYDENGELMLDAEGNPMEVVAPPPPPPTLEETLGFGAKELLENITAYPGMVVTHYDQSEQVNRVTYYQVDSKNKTAVKYQYDKEDGILYSYYDNNQSVGYTNVNSTGWQKLDNERVSQIVPIVPHASFTQVGFTQDNDYLYLEGNITPGADKNIINASLRDLFKNSAENVYLNAVYRADDKSLLNMRLVVESYANTHVVSFTPIMKENTIIIPENAMNLVNPNSVGVSTDAQVLSRIPNYVLLHYAVFDVEAADVNKELIIDKFELIASELKRTYKNIDVDKFIESCIAISTGETISSFVEKNGNDSYTTVEDKAAAEMIYARLLKIDSSIDDATLQKITDASPNPDDPVQEEPMEEVPEEPVEETPEEPVEETPEEPVEEKEPIVQAEANTDVNVRKGPGTGFDKIGRIPKGTIVVVTKVDETDATWSHVILPSGVEGCIKNTYLNTIESEVQSNE